MRTCLFAYEWARVPGTLVLFHYCSSNYYTECNIYVSHVYVVAIIIDCAIINLLRNIVACKKQQETLLHATVTCNNVA